MWDWREKLAILIDPQCETEREQQSCSFAVNTDLIDSEDKFLTFQAHMSPEPP